MLQVYEFPAEAVEIPFRQTREFGSRDPKVRRDRDARIGSAEPEFIAVPLPLSSLDKRAFQSLATKAPIQ